MIDLWAVMETPAGWHFNKRYNLHQRVKGRVYVYITIRLFDGYILQLYKRGQTGICELEIRDHVFAKLVKQGEEWLEQYQDGDLSVIRSSQYSPHNPKGVWA